MVLLQKVVDILNGENALEWVVKNKDVKVCFDELLYREGNRIVRTNWEPLFHVVCRRGKIDIARELIRLGVDVNVHDSHGYGVIHLCYNKPAIVDLLLAQPTFDINQQNSLYGDTPLHDVMYLYEQEQRVPYVLKFLKAGARTDIKNTWGRLPFQDDDTLNDVRRKVQVLLLLCRVEGLSNDIVRTLKNYL